MHRNYCQEIPIHFTRAHDDPSHVELQSSCQPHSIAMRVNLNTYLPDRASDRHLVTPLCPTAAPLPHGQPMERCRWHRDGQGWEGEEPGQNALSLQHNIASHLSARPERFLRFSI